MHLSNKNNQPITFNSQQLQTNKSIATAFSRQFARVVPPVMEPESRRIQRQIRVKHPLTADANPFTVGMVKAAIENSSNSVALGPDCLSMHHLKNLGPRGLKYLQRLYNLSYNHAICPTIWNNAIIVPILKTGKPKEHGT